MVGVNFEASKTMAEDIVEFRGIENRAKAALEDACGVLEGKTFDVRYQTRWTDAITQSAIDALQGLSPNFKFVVNCLLIQKRGDNVVYTQSTAHCDGSTDGLFSIQWESPSILVILSAFAAAI